MFSLTASARADEATFQGRLRLRAPAECPGERDLARQIVEQLSERGLHDAASFAFELEIALRAGRYQGRLRVLAPEPGGDARELDDADCANLVRASALAIAVLIGPRGAEPPPAAPPPEPAPAPSAHPLAPPIDPLPPPLPVTPAPELPPAGARWHLRLGGIGGIVTGMAPKARKQPRA